MFLSENIFFNTEEIAQQVANYPYRWADLHTVPSMPLALPVVYPGLTYPVPHALSPRRMIYPQPRGTPL